MDVCKDCNMKVETCNCALKIAYDQLEERIRKEERERAQKIIEEAPTVRKGNCPMDPLKQCIECIFRRNMENWKQEALKKLNETV